MLAFLAIYKQDTINHFCDNNESNTSTLHDQSSPTQHNQLCNNRSSWQVLREHPDFSGGWLLTWISRARYFLFY